MKKLHSLNIYFEHPQSKIINEKKEKRRNEQKEHHSETHEQNPQEVSNTRIF